MSGLGFWLAVALGGAVGVTWQQLRRGGVLDLRQCADVGHERANRAGYCPRCARRIVMVAP